MERTGSRNLVHNDQENQNVGTFLENS